MLSQAMFSSSWANVKSSAGIFNAQICIENPHYNCMHRVILDSGDLARRISRLLDLVRSFPVNFDTGNININNSSSTVINIQTLINKVTNMRSDVSHVSLRLQSSPCFYVRWSPMYRSCQLIGKDCAITGCLEKRL
jgi:hypothetical protein